MKKKMYRCNDQLFSNDCWLQRPEDIKYILAQLGFYSAMVENGLGILQKIEKGEYRPVPTSPDLPAGFSLQDKMPPVYDQGNRGTCVAQAATALMEYFCDCKWRFSMQYLFERMKRLELEKLEKTAQELVNKQEISDQFMAQLANDVIGHLQEEQKELTVRNVINEMRQQTGSLLCLPRAK